MATKVGVGVSENPTSLDAGKEAARAATAEAGVSTCDLAIMYSTPKHDNYQLRDGVRSVIGPSARLIGGYSVGIITKDMLGYEGYQVGVAIMSSDSVEVDMFIEKGLPDNEYNIGLSLGTQIKSKDYKGEPNILLMYDSIKESISDGMALNLATPLIEGMGQSLGNWPPTAGVGMVGDFQFNPTYQWFDQRIEQGTAMALVFSGDVRLDTIIMHGCKPSSDYHTVTRAEGNVVLEIDGKPAVNAIAEMLGPGDDRSWENYPLFVPFSGLSRILPASPGALLALLACPVFPSNWVKFTHSHAPSPVYPSPVYLIISLAGSTNPNLIVFVKVHADQCVWVTYFTKDSRVHLDIGLDLEDLNVLA
jgi:hypothetical protein